MPSPRNRSRKSSHSRSRSRSRSKSSSRTPSPYFSRDKEKQRSSRAPLRGSQRSRSPRHYSGRHQRQSRSRSPRRRSSRTPERKTRSSPTRKPQSSSRSQVSSNDDKTKKRQRSPSPKSHKHSSRRSPVKRSRSRSPRDRSGQRKPSGDTRGTSGSHHASVKTERHRSHTDDKDSLGQFKPDESSQFRELVKHVESDSLHRTSHHHPLTIDRDEKIHRLPPKRSAPIFPLEDLEREPAAGRLQYKSDVLDSDSGVEYGSRRETEPTYKVLFNSEVAEHIQSKPTLTERFREKDYKPIVFEDNITISIQRNVKGNAPPVIQRVISPDDVFILRKPDEGEKPFYLREEFQVREEEIVERRTIHVSGSRSGTSLRSAIVEEPRKVIRAADDDYGRLPKREFADISSKRHSPDRELEHRMKRSADIADAMRSKRGVPRNPNDLRFNLTRKRDAMPDARERISERRNDSSPIRGGNFRDRRHENRYGKEGRRDEKSLPDFSKRPDKFMFEEWKSKPDMVPKGTSYFEHDNRGEFDYWARSGRGRGRGRGFFRGRGSGFYRGRGRGRGSSSYGSSSGTWKHDKFDEIAEGGDDKPSSTTEK